MTHSTMAKRFCIGGIYMIQEDKSKKMLIGTTHDFETHRKNTLRLLRRGEHPNKGLQKDFDEGHRFSYKALYVQQFPVFRYRDGQWASLFEMAKKYIEQYNAMEVGYNLPYGIGRKSCWHRKETEKGPRSCNS